MSRTRRFFSPEDKVAILRKHFLKGVPTSEIFKQLDLNPAQFYNWQRELFENGHLTFRTPKQDPKTARLESEIAKLRAKLEQKNEVLAELMEEHVILKKGTWGDLKEGWVSPEIRDQIVDFLVQWAKKTEIALCTLILWLGICRSKFYLWQQHYGKVREQDRWIPRDHWITPEEREAIIDYARKHPGVDYRRPTFMCCEFRQFLPLCHHITISPYYPQSNGEIERSSGSLKRERLRPQTPLTVEDARRVIQNYVNEYNHSRLHAAVGYVAPADRLHGLDVIIHQKRDEKLQEARELRRQRRQAAYQPTMRQDNRIDFALLRRTVRIANVLEAFVGLEHYRGSGPQRRGPCPIHQHPDGKNHRSFSVNLQRGIFRCFHPQCQCQGNVLDLWATCHNVALPSAARSLAEPFAPALISPDNTPTIEKRNPSS